MKNPDVKFPSYSWKVWNNKRFHYVTQNLHELFLNWACRKSILKNSRYGLKTLFLHSLETNAFFYVKILHTYEEKAGRQLHKNAASNIEQILGAAPHKVAAVRTPTIHYENYQN